jgi:hypothetical protein
MAADADHVAIDAEADGLVAEFFPGIACGRTAVIARGRAWRTPVAIAPLCRREVGDERQGKQCKERRDHISP